MAIPQLQMEFLYNIGQINPFGDITSIREGIISINKDLDYDDRFFGKDGIYIPHSVKKPKHMSKSLLDANKYAKIGHSSVVIEEGVDMSETMKKKKMAFY